MQVKKESAEHSHFTAQIPRMQSQTEHPSRGAAVSSLFLIKNKTTNSPSSQTKLQNSLRDATPHCQRTINSTNKCTNFHDIWQRLLYRESCSGLIEMILFIDSEICWLFFIQIVLQPEREQIYSSFYRFDWLFMWLKEQKWKWWYPWSVFICVFSASEAYRS